MSLDRKWEPVLVQDDIKNLKKQNHPLDNRIDKKDRMEILYHF